MKNALHRKEKERRREHSVSIFSRNFVSFPYKSFLTTFCYARTKHEQITFTIPSSRVHNYLCLIKIITLYILY